MSPVAVEAPVSQRPRVAPALVVAVVATSLLVAPSIAARPAIPATRDSGDIERLQERANAAPTSLIVRYRDGTTGPRRQNVRAAAQVALAGTSPTVDTDLVAPRGRSVAAAAAALRARPEVQSVTPNYRRAPSVDPRGEPLWPLQWGHHNSGQLINDGLNPPSYGLVDMDVDGYESLAASSGSSSVVVAVIDDGVDFGHPDLAGTAWVNPGESGLDGLGGDKATNGVDDDGNTYVDDVNGWDFCDNDNTVHDFDDDSHGTAVAGTIASQVNGKGVAGIAPATRIMALKFFSYTEENAADPNCNSDAGAIQAIAYAKSFGIRIINASWGGPGDSDELEAAIAGSGALFVTAAGNGGVDDLGDNIDTSRVYPASFTSGNILTVAATENRGRLAAFSNYGRASVDIGAPGQSIPLPCPEDSVYEADWCWFDGTSFSAPYVAGVAALVGAARPDLLAAPTALKARLMSTGSSTCSLAGRTVSGRQLNASHAIDFTRGTETATVSVLPLPGSVLGTSSVATRLSWPVPAGPTPATYRVEQCRSAGSWTQLTNSTTARTRDVTINLSGTYEFRVTPRTSGGALGTATLSRVVTPLRYEEGSSLATKSGTWLPSSSSTASGGRTVYTTATGAVMTFTFNGRTAALVAPMGPTRSSFKVYLDGVYQKTVSLYSSATKSRVVVYTTGTLAYKTHTLKLVHARVGSRIRGEVDAFVVLR